MAVTGRPPSQLTPEADHLCDIAAAMQKDLEGRYADFQPLLEARRRTVRRAVAAGATLQHLADRMGISKSAVHQLTRERKNNG